MNVSPLCVAALQSHGHEAQHWADLETGALITLDVSRRRVRLLPIGRTVRTADSTGGGDS